MAETNFSYSQLEAPADGTILPQGHHVLRGWVWPKTGGHFVDVRARIGGRIFTGVHGLPRPDLATHFNSHRTTALAEYYVVVDLPAGRTTIVLEVLEIEGRWRIFQQVQFTVESCDPPVRFNPSGGPLRWIDYGHGLRFLMRECGRHLEVPLRELAADLVASLPTARITRDAPAPLIGFVDEPASVCCCRFGRIPAFGHLFHPEQNIRRILGTVDLQSWQPLQIGQLSPGPAAFYPQHPHARACGFLGLVDVPSQLPNPVSLRIYAELNDGTLQLGPVVRTTLYSTEVEKAGLAGRASLVFDEAVAAWDDALMAQGFIVSRDDTLEQFMTELRIEHDKSQKSAAHRPVPAAHSSCVTASLPRRLLLATHGLSLQGAPRFLLELAQAYVSAGVTIEVVSAEDGPLRREFAALGAGITIVDCNAVLTATSASAAQNAIAGLLPQADWVGADLVIANSFTTFWAVHAAKMARRPVLFYVHESTTPAIFYDHRISPPAIELATEAFAAADAVSFTTASTQAVHLGYGRPERYHLTPGWAQVSQLDTWIARQDRAQLRRDLGVQPDEQLVCNIGTVSDRKGQHTFVRAIDLLWRRQPALAARTRFILLGGRNTPFDTMLNSTLDELGRSNIIIHPETTDYLRYYLAADIFACSSYEESSPRVIFEAMTCRSPILASDVHGIPELVRHQLEAILIPAGDTCAWGDALGRLLSISETGRELAARARARVENRFSSVAILPQHLRLAAWVAQPSSMNGKSPLSAHSLCQSLASQ